jgi:hypothetical protein
VAWWATVGGELVSLELVLAGAVMVAATSLGAAGSRRAVRALPAIAGGPDVRDSR